MSNIPEKKNYCEPVSGDGRSYLLRQTIWMQEGDFPDCKRYTVEKTFHIGRLIRTSYRHGCDGFIVGHFLDHKKEWHIVSLSESRDRFHFEVNM